MNKFRWAKYDHKGVFHAPDTHAPWSDIRTLCGIPTRSYPNNLHSYVGRGTSVSCKRCLKCLAAARK